MLSVARCPVWETMLGWKELKRGKKITSQICFSIEERGKPISQPLTKNEIKRQRARFQVVIFKLGDEKKLKDSKTKPSR